MKECKTGKGAVGETGLKASGMCRFCGEAIRGIMALMILAAVYLIGSSALAKLGLIPFSYQYEEGIHRFFTWSKVWHSGFVWHSGALSDPASAFFWWSVTASVVWYLPVFGIMRYLCQIFKGIRQGMSPFTQAAQDRLRKISLILFVVGLCKNTVYDSLLNALVYHKLYVRFPDMDWRILALAFLALVLAEIFRYGGKLQDEVDMTV